MELRRRLTSRGLAIQQGFFFLKETTMHLTKVFIYSNMTAQRAQDKVNQLIAEYGDVDNTVNFDLQIENSVAAGKYSETRYTLVVYIYSLNAEV